MSTDESTVDLEVAKIMENTDEEKGTNGRPTLQREHVPVPGLHLSCYKIDKKEGFVPCELEEAIERRCSVGCDTESHDYWIDADVRDDFDATELNEIIHKIRLTPFLRRHLAKPHQIKTPQVLTLSTAVFLVMRVVPPEEDESNDMRYVAALSVKGLLLTVTTCPREGKAAHTTRFLNQSTRKTVEESELPEPTTSGALAMWLLLHVQRVAKIAAELRMESYTMEDKLDEANHDVGLDELTYLKSRVTRIVAVSEEQLECLESLKEGEAVSDSVDFSKLRGSFGILMATAGSSDRMAGRLEKKVADLRTTYDSHQQDKINHRLELLTVLTAILGPLTLMAGLWGMNFSNMPELARPNAYFFALGAMGTVALTLIFVFRRYGWFR